MVLENISQTNVKGIILEKPESELPLDLHLSGTEINKILSLPMEERMKKNELSLMETLMAIKIVLPDEFAGLPIHKYLDFLKTPLSEWKNYKHNYDSFRPYLERLFYFKQIYQNEDFDPGITGSHWQAEMNMLEAHKKDRPMQWFTDYVKFFVAAKTLLPDKPLPFDTQEESTRNYIQQLRGEATGGLWISLAEDLMYVKLLLGQNAVTQLTHEHWQEMTKQLTKYRIEKNWYAFLLMAGSLTVLSADKATITPNGFELIFPEKIGTTNTPSLPETRKF